MTTPPLGFDRGRVLAYRAAAHGLDGRARRALDAPGLALGIQDSPPGSARLALLARGVEPAGSQEPAGEAGPVGSQGVAMAWTLRGAPHLHAVADLPRLAAGLWPHDDADAAARLGWSAPRVRASGLPAAAAVATVAQAVADVRTAAPAGEWTKGGLSAAVTNRVPPGLAPLCRPCGVAHVGEQLLRLATLAGGLAIVSSSPLTFAAIPRWPGIPEKASGTADLVRAYLHLHGPATPADVRTFLDCTAAVVAASWPADAVDVTVEGRPAWALADDVTALLDPPAAAAVRLLPPHDPFLKGSDRWLLVPDPLARKVVWRVLGNPGVLLVHGEPVGVWRPKTTRGRLTLALEPLAGYEAALGDPAIRAALDLEAERVAAARGLPLAAVDLA